MTLGILTNNQHDIFQRGVLTGVQQVAAQHGYAVKVFAADSDQRFAHDMAPEYADVSGLLVIANVADDDLLRRLSKAGKPISLISHQVSDAPIPVVMSNNTQGIAELVRHLVVDRQRRDLVFIRGLTDQLDSQEREVTFREELIRHNLYIPESRFLRGEFMPRVANQSVQALIDSGEHFDAIIAADYQMGIAAVETLRGAGIAVPGEVAVVGFGDNIEAEEAGLTTVAASITEIGACAARQLISQIQGLRISGVTVLSVRLVIRQTS